MFMNSLMFVAWKVFFWVLFFPVQLNEQTNIPPFCNNHKMLSHLELYFKQRIIIVDIRFESWGISLGWYPQLSSSFSGELFGHALKPIMHKQKYLMDHKHIYAVMPACTLAPRWTLSPCNLGNFYAYFLCVWLPTCSRNYTYAMSTPKCNFKSFFGIQYIHMHVLFSMEVIAVGICICRVWN